MKTRLFVSTYKDEIPSRNEEMSFCLEKNLNNPFIDFIHLMVDNSNEFFLPVNDKLLQKFYDHRLQFNDYFELMKDYPEDIKIIANSDIFFDDSLIFLKNILDDICYVLTRWDVKGEKTVFLNHSWSQDAWIFRGSMKDVVGNFELGRLGCDGRIAYELFCAGYKVLNPSKTIKAFHLHTERRSGSNDGHDTALMVSLPRLQVSPSFIEEGEKGL